MISPQAAGVCFWPHLAPAPPVLSPLPLLAPALGLVSRLGLCGSALAHHAHCVAPLRACFAQVVALMYREDFMPPGMVAPYQIKLDKGDLIYAPADEDDIIRKA